MIPYILQVTVIITICFLFYKIFLQKETFYRLNRWTLMTCLAVAFALPLLRAPRQWSWREQYEKVFAEILANPEAAEPILLSRPPLAGMHQADPEQSGGSVQINVSAQPAPVQSLQGALPSNRYPRSSQRSSQLTDGVVTSGQKPITVTYAENETPHTLLVSPVVLAAGKPLLTWLLYLYCFGVFVFGANFLLQIVVLLYRSSKSPVIKDGRFRIVETSVERAPCSFGNYIFINPSIYDWETYHQILIHEKIHVSGRHTLDILMAEIVVVLQWFNPFAWLYRKEVENNLEFLTDQAVLLHREVEKTAYQLSLLRVCAPHLPFSITTNYNQSLLKRRIVMMNSQHSSLRTVWKYFFLLPVLTLVVCAINKPAVFGQSSADLKEGKVQSGLPTSSARQRTQSTVQDPTAKHAGVSVPFDDTSGRKDVPATRSADQNDVSGRSDPDNGVTVTTSVVVAPIVVSTSTQATASTVSVAEVQVAPVIEMNYERGDETEGSWFVTTEDNGKLDFELKGGSEDHNWSNNFNVEKGEINPFPGQGNVEFKIVREAGTMSFKGQFDGQQGFGHYTFAADERFLTFLKEQGVEDMEERGPMTLFFANVKKDFVTMIQRNGYPHISRRNLASMAFVHVDENYIRSWKQAGYTDLSERDLISARATHVDPAFAQEVKAAGYEQPSLRDLISLKAMHIDGQYLRSVRVAYGTESPAIRDVISFKASHIDSAYVAALKNMGYDNLTYRDIIQLHSMQITTDFIKSYQTAGYKDIPARTLISLKSMNICPDFIKGFKAVGYDNIELRELSSLKAIGVTPAFAQEFQKIGYDHVPLRELQTLKSMGIDAAYVTKMKEKGFDSKDLNKYIRLKNAFD
jgi:BlaR1 peptidase M56